MNSNNSFLGRGWSFPPTFDNRTRTVQMVEGVDDINESLEILLSTSLGERVMQPKYGCNLVDYQFEPLDVSLISFIENLVEKAILFFEPRVKLKNIDITKPESFDLIEGKLTISIDYEIIGTNSRENYVYDFYLREANQPT